MKKFIAILVSLLLIGSAALGALCEYASLRDLQEIIYTHAPKDLGEIPASIKGTIQSIENVTGNYYEMVIQVDDAEAMKPIGSDNPLAIGHFRLHLSSLDDAPFAVGSEVQILGSLNSAYSTYLVPYLMIDEINGHSSEEF